MFDFISISFYFKNKQTQFEVLEMAMATRQRAKPPTATQAGGIYGPHELEPLPGAGHPKEKSYMRVIFLFTSYLVSSFLQ